MIILITQVENDECIKLELNSNYYSLQFLIIWPLCYILIYYDIFTIIKFEYLWDTCYDL